MAHSSRPRLLDLFSGAGGSARGYQLAGFHVTGVDHKAQPRYCGDEFIQADALEYVAAHGHEFDAIHASPPCQVYHLTTRGQDVGAHLDLVGRCQSMIRATGRPYVIENVPGAPLWEPVMLCGSSFGLDIRRHRLFESNIPLLTPGCAHGWQRPRFMPWREGRRPASVINVTGNANRFKMPELWARAMGIDWMARRELTQAIPPAYTLFLGTQLLTALEATA